MRKGLIVILLALAIGSQAQHRTQVMDSDIRTLRMRYMIEALEPSGTVNRPYLVLPESGMIDGSEDENTLEISFDEMSHDVHQYSYRVVHCNRDWTESNISSYEYVYGFTTADIVDYEHSMNTQQAYTHYWFSFPNSDMQLKASGNYVVQIYEDGDQDRVVAEVCFHVVEPLARVEANVRANTDIELNGRYQQLDLDVTTAALNMRDANDVKVVVQQNGRWDNQVVLEKPTFVEPNRLRYVNQKALIFEGGNEYRHFDIYSSYYAGYHVDRVEYAQGEYHALLDIDEVRGTKNKNAGREGLPYLTEMDANGQWLVNCEKTEYVDTEAEYMWVHFVLPVEQYVMDGHVFVGGELFGNQYGAQNRMEYDADNRCYYLYVYLKQGGYDYMYYVWGKNGVTTLPLEGSHWQTENEYMIWVYYRSFGERYDRLVAAKRL
ncbi:MAG: DUF5103 domain-containing protein [Paludibacteraceae bacterium]|nr:DUF5103 domain-containing protein [Paludibacteraceae bacterium]